MNLRDITAAIASLRRKAKWHLEKSKIVHLKPQARPRGNVLISYMIEPFLLKDEADIPPHHSSYWECVQMARTFLELGYAVDVINSYNKVFTPKKPYAYFVEHRMVLERVGSRLNPDCIKIMHIDTAHLLFNNAAEANRLLDLQQRRGVTLRPRRFIMPNLAIEHADCATILGNQFTMSTFAYANKPLFRVPVSSAKLYDWPGGKNFESCRRRFLWFNSGGMIHKGLDLVLEAFAATPQCDLTVCGPVENEPDFARAFHKELYETPNIRTFGWIDIASREFLDIADSCLAHISPSCSEGCSGAVITCMHAGLIPIASYQSGVDIGDDVGAVLRTCSIAEIQQSVSWLSGQPATTLAAMARNAWKFARDNHTRERFADSYRAVIHELERTRGAAIRVASASTIHALAQFPVGATALSPIDDQA
jgi:glycosyltransferase involved in cell wall biosynthesis